MNSCEFEKYFIEYVSGEMENSEKLRFQLHLEKCPICPNKLDEFYSIHQKIGSRARLKPSELFLNEYHNSISQMFPEDSKENVIIEKLIQIYEFLVTKKSYRIRFVEVAGLILLGIIVGWFVFTPSQNQVNENYTDSQHFSQQIPASELAHINYYFQAAELLLLEIKNFDESMTISSADFEFNRSIAQKLLIKTFIVHEIALRHNDPQILRFLTKMEILLYEISNLDVEELNKSTLELFNLIIDDTNLLNEARHFQKRLTKFRNPRNINGTTRNPFLDKKGGE